MQDSKPQVYLLGRKIGPKDLTSCFLVKLINSKDSGDEAVKRPRGEAVGRT